MGENPFRFHPTWGPRAALVLVLALVAAPVSAAPIVETLFYDGYDGLGVSYDAAVASGIPRLSPAVEPFDTERYDTSHGFIPETIFAGPPATATENWTLTNHTGEDQIGTVYLVFGRPAAGVADVDGKPEPVSYDPSDVGLTLRNGAGGVDWVLIEASTSGPESHNLYLPAVALGSLLDGETSDVFQLDYVLNHPQIFAESGGFELGIPSWQAYTAFVPVPEPSTALLLAGGLAALALGRRRRA